MPRILDLLLVVAFIAPLALAVGFRHRALAGRDELAARWFAFARRNQFLAAWGPLVWVALVLEELRQPSLLQLEIGRGALGAGVAVGLVLAPVAILGALLGLLGHEVARRLGTTELGWREALARAAWTIAGGTAPAIFVALAVFAIAQRAPALGLLLFPLGAVVTLLSFARARRGITLDPHAVTRGPLRDRLFEIAARAGVKLRQIYVLPMQRLKLANAFAVNGQIVMVTDLLLARLSRAEVDAVMAHEIAHLKRGDPLKLFAARLGLGLFPFFALLPLGFGWAVLASFAGTVAAAAISRTIERATDREALRLGADPRALISGLARLARLSHVPLAWSRWTARFVTHPSIVERAQLLAGAASLDEAEVARLLAATGEAADRYELPPSLERGGRVFSTRFKHRVMARNTVWLLAVVTLVPTALFAEVRTLGLALPHLARFAAALVLTPAIALLVVNFLAVQPLRRLRAALAERLGLGRRPEAQGWSFAGVAPHAEPRVYEGFASWDVGWFRIGEDRLEFSAEEAGFALAPGAIREITIVDGVPGWIPTRAVLLRWIDARGIEHALRIAPLDVGGMHAIAPRAEQLAARLTTWRAARPGSGAALTNAASPPDGEITCTNPRALARPRTLVALAMFDAIFGALFAVLLGVPLVTFAGPGLLDVVVIALATQFFFMIPALRYRDRVEPARSTGAGEQRAAA